MRPTILHVGGVLYWVIRTRDPDTQLLKDADATPTVVIVKNGTVTVDSVTINKRSATTGIYDCSYNPAGEVEGDDFTVEESAQVTGTTTAQATYSNSWAFGVVALERGTDSALLAANYTAPPTASAIADAVLTESVMDHRNVANSLAKFVWQIRQANLTVDGTVSNAITPTTLTFASNVAATTSAYAHAVLLFITGPLTGENSPIISYNNTNGVFVLEEPLTAAPTSGDEFVVIAGSHVHSVADIQSGLALEATLTSIKGAGFATGTDSLKELRDAVDGIDAGGGDTAEEIVDEIVARGITAIPVQSGVTSSGNLELIQGDTYNGTAKPLLSFPTSANYTDGWTATLTIRDEEDAVVATASGVVVSSTQVTVSFTTPTGLTFTGCPGVWQGKFDVQMSKSTQRATIARGIAYVYEDQTRS
jgi:hypothetical protein